MNIRDKIEKLLALAADQGATEHEAQTAIEMATALATKHSIDLTALHPGATPPGAVELDIEVTSPGHYPWYLQVGAACCKLYGGRCVQNPDENKMHLYATDDVIDAIEMTFDFIIDQIEEWYKKALKERPGMNTRQRTEYRTSFKWAAANRVNQRAYDYQNKMITDDAFAKQQTGHNALVVRENFRQREDEVKAFWKEMGVHLTRGRAVGGKPGAGTRDGAAAGNRVSMHRTLS